MIIVDNKKCALGDLTWYLSLHISCSLHMDYEKRAGDFHDCLVERITYFFFSANSSKFSKGCSKVKICMLYCRFELKEQDQIADISLSISACCAMRSWLLGCLIQIEVRVGADVEFAFVEWSKLRGFNRVCLGVSKPSRT